MVSIKEQFMIKSGIWWSAYMISKVKSIHKLIWPKINLNWHNNHRSCNAIYQNKDGLRDFWTKVGNACHSDAAVREFNKTCFLHAHNWMPNSPCRAQLSTHNNWPPLLIHSTKKTSLEVISFILAKLDMAKKSIWKLEISKCHLKIEYLLSIFISYHWLKLSFPHQTSKSLQIEIFCHFKFCHIRRNGFWLLARF